MCRNWWGCAISSPPASNCVGFGNDPGESVTASESLAQRLVAGGHTELDHFVFLSSEINGFST